VLFEDVIPASEPESPFPLLDPIAPVPSESLDSKEFPELVDEPVESVEGDDRVHEELEDSSTEALLPSSPQATRKKNTVT
jgi:hypothetical protein